MNADIDRCRGGRTEFRVAVMNEGTKILQDTDSRQLG